MAANIQDVKPAAEQMQEIADLRRIGRHLFEEPHRPYREVLIAERSKLQREAAEMARRTGQHARNIDLSEQMAQQARGRYPEQYRRYMNPYENQVSQTMARDINRNFTENVLPSLEAHFIKRGQHGSSKHRDLARRAQRDMQSELLSKLGQLRAHGYETGAQHHAAEQEREMNLARLMAGLGAQRQASHITDIGLMNEIGAAEQQHRQNEAQAKYSQWLRGEASPYEKFEMRRALLEGLPYQHIQSSIQFHEPQAPEPVLNRAGNIGALAMGALAARHAEPAQAEARAQPIPMNQRYNNFWKGTSIMRKYYGGQR